MYLSHSDYANTVPGIMECQYFVPYSPLHIRVVHNAIYLVFSELAEQVLAGLGSGLLAAAERRGGGGTASARGSASYQQNFSQMDKISIMTTIQNVAHVVISLWDVQSVLIDTFGEYELVESLCYILSLERLWDKLDHFADRCLTDADKVIAREVSGCLRIFFLVYMRTAGAWGIQKSLILSKTWSLPY